MSDEHKIEYRVVRQSKDGEGWLSVQEVYFDGEDKAYAHTTDLQVDGDSISDIRKTLQAMLWALDKDLVTEIQNDVMGDGMEERITTLEMENAEMRDRLTELGDNMSERIRENLKNLKTGKKTNVTDEDVDQWKKDVLKRGGI